MTCQDNGLDCVVKTTKNDKKFLKWEENAVGKGEIAHHEQFLLFPQCFQNTRTADA